MRNIRKTNPPPQLIAWLTTNSAKGLDVSYDALSGKPAHQALKKHLLKEQGYLCAYTGREIEKDTAHLEHLKPQKKCQGKEDVAYRNLVACFPADGGDVSHGYGAPLKADWWDATLFLSPCAEDAERHFKFSWSGRIEALPPNHKPAQKTISVLKLDNKSLRDMRRKAIVGFFGLSSKSPPLKLAEAKRLIGKIDQPDRSGKLLPFVFALKQLLPGYIQNFNQ